jgi:heterodisulfide reductase subunit A
MDVIVLSVGWSPAGARATSRPSSASPRTVRLIATPGEPMDPVSTSVPGIYVAGAAAGPKDLEDSMSMAGAAAMRALRAARQPIAGQAVAAS